MSSILTVLYVQRIRDAPSSMGPPSFPGFFVTFPRTFRKGFKVFIATVFVTLILHDLGVRNLQTVAHIEDETDCKRRFPSFFHRIVFAERNVCVQSDPTFSSSFRRYTRKQFLKRFILFVSLAIRPISLRQGQENLGRDII